MNEWTFHTGDRGLALTVCEWGRATPGGLPIVVLHGFLEQGAAWDGVARRLGGRVLAPDLRGHGRSDHVGAGGFYHFWDYVPDVLALIAHLGGRVDLVGHSMGGTIAMLVAGLRPSAVRRLVSVEGLGPPDGDGAEVDRADRFADAMAEPPRHAPLDSVQAAADRLRKWNRSLTEAEALRLAARTTRPAQPSDVPDEPLAPGAVVWTWDPLHRARAPFPFRDAAFRSFLRRIEAPVLYVAGEVSPYRLPAIEARAAEVRDLRTVVVPGAGHLIHHDAPDVLARHIAAHLAPET